MTKRAVTQEAAQAMHAYEQYLREEEKSANTIVKYLRDLRAFFAFMGEQSWSKAVLLAWKEELMKTHAPASINSMLAAVNGYLDWKEWTQYKVKPLKIQRAIFARPERELSRAEYNRLVMAAKDRNNERLALLLQTICATGIRVSELPFITVSAVQSGRAVVDCKGKTRLVFLPKDLCRHLRQYCRLRGIARGVVFCTAGGKALDRSNIWRDMKTLCRCAAVAESKVFPHNLRHLFARTYYTLEKDLSRLADLLGHSNLATTRIYTMESGYKHLRQINRMGLVLDQKE